ncbi:hypothetical protein [Nocardiopsis sp. CNT312]|uniref:hypothetical protein n=1 Tax=Nocardiopsis sp. CNT312 TaxID=1137268 RepID=UPI0012DC8699|nr:hypothetical protein [Nocardiopsis sp. CNT312]
MEEGFEFLFQERKFLYRGRIIHVVDYDDLTSEARVIGFEDPEKYPLGETHSVSVPYHEGWGGAKILIDPRVGELPVDYVMKCIEAAEIFVSY